MFYKVASETIYEKREEGGWVEKREGVSDIWKNQLYGIKIIWSMKKDIKRIFTNYEVKVRHLLG